MERASHGNSFLFLDIENAYNSVWWNGLLHKIISNTNASKFFQKLTDTNIIYISELAEKLIQSNAFQEFLFGLNNNKTKFVAESSFLRPSLAKFRKTLRP
jgi:hypothetical protein